MREEACRASPWSLRPISIPNELKLGGLSEQSASKANRCEVLSLPSALTLQACGMVWRAMVVDKPEGPKAWGI